MLTKRVNIFEILICIYYTWFFLPICNATFSGGVYKYFFFSLFAIGVIGLLVLRAKQLTVPINSMVVAVIIYFAVMTLMYLWDIADASAHIRVSFTFWGTLLLYFFVFSDEGKVRFGKFLLFMFIITCITSSIGVLIDNDAARTIAHAGAEEDLQLNYKMKNIANIYLFQGMVMLIPALIGMAKTKNARIWLAVLLAILMIVLVNASFTISLIMFFVTLAVSSLCIRSKNHKQFLLKLLLVILLVAVLLFAKNIFLWLASAIDNPRISERFVELAYILYGDNQTMQGDVSLRLDLYKASLNTFLDNVFGIGPQYSYVKFDDGIGYHSQILDDMARFGLWAVAFYAMFFYGYYKLLKKEWSKIGSSFVAPATTITYALFLIQNIGFRSSEESILTLFIIPILPSLILHQKEKRKKRKTVVTKGRRAYEKVAEKNI